MGVNTSAIRRRHFVRRKKKGVLTPLKIIGPGSEVIFLGWNFALQIEATGGSPPYTFSATGLPHGIIDYGAREGQWTGFKIDPNTGWITGVLDMVWVTQWIYNSVITVTDVLGQTASLNLEFDVELIS